MHVDDEYADISAAMKPRPDDGDDVPSDALGLCGFEAAMKPRPDDGDDLSVEVA